MSTPPAFCPACGTRRLGDARFCVTCGADLGAAAPSPAAGLSEALPPGPVGPVDAAQVVVTPASPPPSAPARRPSRTPLLIALLLVLLVGGGAGLWWLLRPSAGPAGTPDGSTPAPSSRVYEGVFTPTGSLATARDYPSVTLLPDGRVLVVGGRDGDSNPLATAELYDPRTGTFSPTGSLAVARYSPSITLLADGRVLVAGGIDANGNNGPIADAELYDPRTGVFTPTGSLAVARFYPSVTLLADGRVLVVGGPGPNFAPIISAELFQ